MALGQPANRLAVADVRIRQNNGASRCYAAAYQYRYFISWWQRENRLPANSVWCGFWFPRLGMVVINFCLPSVLLGVRTHFFTQRNGCTIPRLLELCAPVAW